MGLRMLDTTADAVVLTGVPIARKSEMAHLDIGARGEDAARTLRDLRADASWQTTGAWPPAGR